jgi:hypothetical protein
MDKAISVIPIAKFTAQSQSTHKWKGLILALLIFIPHLLNLDVFLTADEPLFLKHSREFAAAFRTGDLKQTLGIGYPGVTIAGWAAPLVSLASNDLAAYVAGRVTAVLLNGLLLLGLYRLSGRLVGRGPAFIGVALLALDPYTLSYSRLFHLEAPLALFMSLAGLSCILWLCDNKWQQLALTGLFTGLALLTKSTALLLGPMLGAIVISWGLLTGQGRIPAWWLARLKGALIIGLVASVVFTILWPAMWLEPLEALNLTFGKLLNDQEASTGNMGFFWWGQPLNDPGPAFYPVAFLLKATPWLLLGLILSLFYSFRSISSSRKEPMNKSFFMTSISLWLFALTYLFLMTVASKKSVRYLLPAFPAFYLLAGIAFAQAGAWLRQRSSSVGSVVEGGLPASATLRGGLQSALRQPGGLLIIPLLFVFFYQPYYLTYYNPAVLGWRWAPQTLLVGWGEGLDQAATYLNGRTTGPVVAWYEWLFPVFYQGEVQAVVPPEHLITAPYSVLYINQVQRNIPDPNLIHYFQTRRRPDYTVRLAGIDYAWVYPGPIAGFGVEPQPAYPLEGEFGGELQLLGYDLNVQPVLSGNPLVVTLYWQVLRPPSSDRFVYVRLVDLQGRIWASADSPPVMGFWLPSRWEPGMVIEDAQALEIPPGTPPGLYHLEVGLYEPATGQVMAAGGQPVGQGGGLLLGEVTVEWQALPPGEIDLPHLTNTQLSPHARLLGYETLSEAATSGDVLPVRLAWQEASSLFQWGDITENLVMFEWSREGQPEAEQLEALPLPIGQWGRGAVLRSQHELIVPPTLETGRYDLRVMLHDGSQAAGEPFYLGSLEVTAPPHEFNLPAAAKAPPGPAQLEGTILLAGYNLQRVDGALTLDLYWQTQQPVPKRYKVFAQLLKADNGLISQSDSSPATGHRPTTSWLPGEIIHDPHQLLLPPDLPPPPYRLIAGLYNPLNGERLPLVDQKGETIGDSILVTEVVGE